MFFHPLFQTALVRLLGSRHRRTSPTTGERKHKCRDCHADGCENRCDGNSLLTKQVANALSQCGVFMEVPPECLTDSVDLGTEGYSVRKNGFEPCLSLKFDVRKYSLELSDSVSNLSLHFSVVCFRQFSVLPGEVSFDLGYSPSILVSFARLFANFCFIPVIAFSSPASSLLTWVTHTVSIGRSSIVVRVLSTCSVLCRLCRGGPRVRCYQGCFWLVGWLSWA